MLMLRMTLRSDDVDVENDICHTLISSRDHCLLACDLRLTTSKCLTLIVGESVKFRDVSKRNQPKNMKTRVYLAKWGCV